MSRTFSILIVDDIPPTFEDIHAGTERWLGAAKR